MNATHIIAMLLLGSVGLVWAAAWWDVERRKTQHDERTRNAESRMKAFDARVSVVLERLEKLERNPATMSATKERVDTLEKAMANLVTQVNIELDAMRARTMTISSRVDARRFGARPNG